MAATGAPPGRTPGQELAAALRYYLSVGTRTRRHRRDGYGHTADLHSRMIDAITEAAQLPGAHSERVERALRPGYGAALAYEKHVKGYRVPGTLAQRINAMTPWQFAALLGQMVDAGVENTGQGERFFYEMHHAA
jgi:hypothetical protein